MRSGLLESSDQHSRWMAGYLTQWAIIALAFVLCGVVSYRAGGARAAKKYEAWTERFADEYIAQQEAALRGIPKDPREVLRQQQTTALAKVLYGIKGNSADDLRTACWCVFNRVDSAGYPDTLEEVIAQPQQWMGYDESNPVLEDLYRIAGEELAKWQDGATRPCSADFVFMTWSPSKIVLRDNWTESSWTERWRYGA